MLNNSIRTRHYVLLGIASFIGLSALLFFVNPEDKPVVYILAPVVLVWIGLFCMLSVMVRILFAERKALHTIFITIGSSSTVLLLLLSGLGQLSVRDFVLTILLTSIGSFYVYRTWSQE